MIAYTVPNDNTYVGRFSTDYNGQSLVKSTHCFIVFESKFELPQRHVGTGPTIVALSTAEGREGRGGEGKIEGMGEEGRGWGKREGRGREQREREGGGEEKGRGGRREGGGRGEH